MRVPTAIRLLVGLVFVSALVAAPASTATAHTDFDYSLPTDGASVPEPVDEITVGFTLPVTLVGNGFVVLDPQGNESEPFAVTDDDTVFRLQLDRPIAGGEAAVRYEVRAEDGHVLTGGFRFTIDAPVPTTVTTVTPTSEAATTTTTTTTTTTAAPTAGGAETTTSSAVVVSSSSMPTVPDDAGSDGNMAVVAAAGVVALGAAMFLFVRSRPTN